MKFLSTFIKGIVVGIGGIAPGLSGSVMLLILGLYEKAVNAISTLFKGFKNFKKNLLFLIPLVLGFGCGVLIFSKVVDFLLENYEFHTRYLFLGLVIGTVPLFYKSVTKNGYKKSYYIIVAVSLAVGIALFSFNKNLFPVITEPNLFQSVILGVAVAGSSIIPGVDSAVILSALGLYELYVGSIADMNFEILIPAAFGLVAGAFLISMFMNFLIKKFYAVTFSVIFGLFLSIIPSVLTEECAIISLGGGILAVILTLLGFIISFYFSDIQGNNQRIKRILKK